ncbi:MAG TPA: nucleoside triphosphate pyrophosphatase [Casimicrobiaceae bacterium]|nr:nucleoside triphosphate pyrophosphatase [Casimicrobiaceae bacterium]
MTQPFLLTERPSVYLASKSPRRQALLRQIGVEFEELLLREAAGRRRDVLEVPRKDESPLDYVKRIARTKAAVGWHRMGRRGLPPKPVLAADTEVVVDGDVLGKPEDAASATQMLKRLSGRSHEVITAVAVRWDAQIVQAVARSQVTFRVLAGDEITRYVATGEPFDKAGGYAVQGRAAIFIRRIEGSYSGVMGLPLYETAEILSKIGHHVI